MHLSSSRAMQEGESMSRRLMIIFVVVLILGVAAASAYAGERVTNGTFGSSTGWTNWQQRGTFTRNFNSTTGIPTGGASPCIQMNSTDGNGGIYQALSPVKRQS